MTEKLLPCPFCGSDNAPGVYDENEVEGLAEGDLRFVNKPYYSVVCSLHDQGCGAEGAYCKTPEEAIAAWNRRTPDVVRCGECENWGDEYYCPFIGKTTLYNFFCGYGVRKDCSVCGKR